MTPIAFWQYRQGAFVFRREQALGIESRLQRSKAWRRAPSPAGSMCSAMNWYSPRGS